MSHLLRWGDSGSSLGFRNGGSCTCWVQCSGSRFVEPHATKCMPFLDQEAGPRVGGCSCMHQALAVPRSAAASSGLMSGIREHRMLPRLCI